MNAPDPISPWRAECNRLVLDAAVRDYDRRHARTSRQESSAVRGAALAEAITRETAA